MAPTYDFDSIREYIHQTPVYVRDDHNVFVDRMLDMIHRQRMSYKDCMVIMKEMIRHMDNDNVIKFMENFSILCREIANHKSYSDYYRYIDHKKYIKRVMMDKYGPRYNGLYDKWDDEAKEEKPKDFLSEKDMEL
jgi:hypothetical protein